MGAEMNLNTEINCKLDLSPNTVLPPLHQYSKGDSRYAKASFRKDELLRVKDGFTEISFRHYRSSSCKNAQSKSLGLDGHVELKTGSVYQSSKEVRKWTKNGTDESRRKIEFSQGNFTPFSPSIVNSLCSSDEDIPKPAVSKHKKQPCATVGFIEICPNLDRLRQESGNPVGEDTKDSKIGCKPTACSVIQERTLPEKDRVSTLQQSLPAMVEVLDSPSSSESDISYQANSRTRFSPIRKIFDPFRKSKSLRAPSGYGTKALDVKISGMDDMRRCKALKKSLLPDFLNTAEDPQFNNQCINRDPHCSVVASSPVHLHGHLKLQNKNGRLLFELSMNQQEDILVAKTWKREKAFNWVYTFHSLGRRKSSNASILNSNDSHKKSSLVGQMQVSCYLCSEVKSNGAFCDSLVTEFVLYDIAHARNYVSPWQSDDDSDSVKVETQSDAVSGNSDFSSSNESIQRPSINLDPSLETAAIAIQVPIQKRESLKYRRGEKGGENDGSDLINISWVDEGKKVSQDNESHELKVIIPAGFHGLPSAKSPGPSSLLDRWRLGGGCDCGGWDMACPLVVLGNPNIKCSKDRPYMDVQRPFHLSVQGTKDSLPALTLTSTGEGEYAIDFHAQLSCLQAFSICVAVLHGNEASAAAIKEEGVTRSNTLEKLLQKEVNFLIKAVTEEKKKLNIKVDEIPASFMLNPPFSPIARV